MNLPKISSSFISQFKCFLFIMWFNISFLKSSTILIPTSPNMKELPTTSFVILLISSPSSTKVDFSYLIRTTTYTCSLILSSSLTVTFTVLPPWLLCPRSYHSLCWSKVPCCIHCVTLISLFTLVQPIVAAAYFMKLN